MLVGVKHHAGFSLVEMAIVLVIVSLLIGGALGPLASQIENSRRQHTQQNLDLAKNAILGFAMAAGRIPCPDTDGDGIENPLGGTGGCTAGEGDLPFVTLSINVDDAWNQSIRYLVDSRYADDIDGTGCGVAMSGVSFELCSQGNISIRDAVVAGNTVAINLPLALLSRGKHWVTDRSAEERENTDGDSVLVDRVYTTANGVEFDDIVEWISASAFRFAMVDSGLLGS